MDYELTPHVISLDGKKVCSVCKTHIVSSEGHSINKSFAAHVRTAHRDELEADTKGITSETQTRLNPPASIRI